VSTCGKSTWETVFTDLQRHQPWQHPWYPRRFFEDHSPFGEMEPDDSLSSGGDLTASNGWIEWREGA
jgi:hypothetical protein